MRGAVDGLPSPHPLARTLPGLYQDESFAERLCAALDEVLAPVAVHARQPAGLPRPGDGARTTCSRGWPAGSGCRSTRDSRASGSACLLRRAVALHGWQGTARGIELAVEAVFGLPRGGAGDRRDHLVARRRTPRCPAHAQPAFVVRVLRPGGARGRPATTRPRRGLPQARPRRAPRRGGARLTGNPDAAGRQGRVSSAATRACSRRVAAAEPASPIRSWISASSSQAVSRSGSSSVAQRASGSASAGGAEQQGQLCGGEGGRRRGHPKPFSLGDHPLGRPGLARAARPGRAPARRGASRGSGAGPPCARARAASWSRASNSATSSTAPSRHRP